MVLCSREAELVHEDAVRKWRMEGKSFMEADTLLVEAVETGQLPLWGYGAIGYRVMSMDGENAVVANYMFLPNATPETTGLGLYSEMNHDVPSLMLSGMKSAHLMFAQTPFEGAWK